MVNILTGAPFDTPKRMNHREDELTAEFPSSAGSRRLGLLALKACNWGVAPVSKPIVGEAYIETDGNSYMDLGFVPSSSMDYEISLRVSNPNGSTAFIFGTSASTITDSRFKMAETSSGIALLTPSIAWGDYDRSLDNAMKRHVYALSGDYYVIDGVKYPARNVGTAPTGNMLIGSAVVGRASSKSCFYYAKFWESGVLVRDLVPYSGPRGVGLLDKVHDVLYTNAGSGELTYGPAFVQTKGLADSFWAAPISQLGCSVAPANPEHFAFVVDMEYEDGYFTGDYGIFGFTKCNGFFHQNMDSGPKGVSVYAYAPGSVINVNGYRQIVTPGERHVITFEFDPLVGNSVDVDGEVSLGKATSLKLPYDTNFRFGGQSGSTVVTSVTKPVKMRVYGVKILQFHNLVADLVPYNDGSDVGMMDKLSGNKFPGSNLEYGEV